MKDTLIEIKNDLQGNNNRVDEAENQINGLDHKEETDINYNRRKKQELKKMRRGLGSSQTTLNVPTSEL